MYGTKQENVKQMSLNELRYKHFEKLTQRESFKLECLPPSEGAATQHCYRTYHQIQMWFGIRKDATSWGWKRSSNGLTPIYSSDRLIPEDLMKKIHCTCKTGCKSENCSCQKYGLRCTNLCSGCSGGKCSNIDIDIPNASEQDLLSTELLDPDFLDHVEENLLDIVHNIE
ncbi:hypothetical protein QAD02_020681 [Eretmocerus hayati]|uniref:Uncharacterized protein n=1 Tax=Eretmocerus hayati TaxID=131215 RepID=A0ACC2PP44_9HYME|nr:hypothetical protein QAD02_020681 [Eretmocerus hayati]